MRTVQKHRGDRFFSFPKKENVSFWRTLSDGLASRLSEKFPHAVQSELSLGNAFADLVVQDGRRLVIAEFKTGDPELPLPSSTAPQMKLLRDQAHLRFPSLEILAIVITNFQVSDLDKKVLQKEGVEILSISSSLNIDALVSEFVRAMGAGKEPAASSG